MPDLTSDDLRRIYSYAPAPVPDLAWAAGIIDGEGCIQIQRTLHSSGTATYMPRIAVQMCHRPTVERLKNIFRVGRIVERWDGHPKHRVAHKWYCCARKAMGVIWAVRPYLFTKREEADIIVRLYEEPPIVLNFDGIQFPLHDTREELYQAICAAKGRLTGEE